MPIPISHVVLSQVCNGSCTPGLTNPAVCFEGDYKGYLKYKIENLTGFYGPNTLWATSKVKRVIFKKCMIGFGFKHLMSTERVFQGTRLIVRHYFAE